MIGRKTRERLDCVADRVEDVAIKAGMAQSHAQMAQRVAAAARPAPDPRTPQQRHHEAILSNYHAAVAAAGEAKAVLDHAESVCAQAATALVEARKQMRRVAEGTI